MFFLFHFNLDLFSSSFGRSFQLVDFAFVGSLEDPSICLISGSRKAGSERLTICGCGEGTLKESYPSDKLRPKKTSKFLKLRRKLSNNFLLCLWAAFGQLIAGHSWHGAEKEGEGVQGCGDGASEGFAGCIYASNVTRKEVFVRRKKKKQKK